MSQENGQPLDNLELACLPATDPRRRQHAASLPRGARDEFEREAALTDELRANLPEVQVPEGLTARLLAIPQTASPAVVTRKGPFQRRVPWPIAATIIGLIGIAAFYLLFIHQPAKPAQLDAEMAGNLAGLAVAKADAPLEITSADSASVQQKLASHGLGFPVLMLQPTAGTLEGGGVCDLGGAPAVFTRWHAEGQTYTLFEFDGKRLNVPGLFYAMTTMPADPDKAGGHRQVYLFPGTGGKCCWALVMENETSPNIFSQYGTAY